MRWPRRSATWTRMKCRRSAKRARPRRAANEARADRRAAALGRDRGRRAAGRVRHFGRERAARLDEQREAVHACHDAAGSAAQGVHPVCVRQRRRGRAVRSDEDPDGGGAPAAGAGQRQCGEAGSGAAARGARRLSAGSDPDGRDDATGRHQCGAARNQRLHAHGEGGKLPGAELRRGDADHRNRADAEGDRSGRGRRMGRASRETRTADRGHRATAGEQAMRGSCNRYFGTAKAVLLLAALVAAGGHALAQEAGASNSIERIDATQTSVGVFLTIQLKQPLGVAPANFSVTNPARIAIDLPLTVNNLGRSSVEINQGDLRSVNVVQAQGRARVVLNLRVPVTYTVTAQGNAIQVVLGSKAEAATFPAPQPVAPQAAAAQPSHAPMAPEPRTIRAIDFRRGAVGEGRVVVDLSDPTTSVDIRQQGQQIVVDFLNATLPESMRRRLDVSDFGTPIAMVSTTQQGGNVHMVIEPRGLWEQNAYQGERLSLNFQNVDVRSLLQVIADFTNLNIITSDSVQGAITLRLKDVPWDQALDIILQSKGLDMRKNGN